MIREFVETEHVRFDFQLSNKGRRMMVFWRWRNDGNEAALKVSGKMTKKPVPDDVEILWMEMPEGADFDALCDLLEATVRAEWATIKTERDTMRARLIARFKDNQ